MASKKRRIRAARAHPHPISGGLSLPSSSRENNRHASSGGLAPVVPGMTQGMAQLTFNGGDVTKGKRVESPGCSLMRLPRNIRDDIYALLLSAPAGPQKSAQVNDDDDEIESYHASTRPAAVFEQNQILPGSSRRYPFIVEALGLLLANKQLHSEANTYLFSNNTFVIMPEWDRIHCFWSCNNNVCRPDVPCLVHLRNFRQLKHLYILVNNPHDFEDKSQKYATHRLRRNLKTIIRCLKEAGVNLLTLKVRYVSCLRGQIDLVRDKLDAEPKNWRDGCTVTLRSAYGDQDYTLKPGEDYSILLQNTSVLDELATLPGIAKSVTVMGDLSTSYIADLTRVLAAPPDPDEDEVGELNESVVEMKESAEPAGLEVQEALVTENKATHFPERDDTEARAALLQKLALDHPDDKEMHDFCKKTMREPMYTAAFMEQMLVPTKEEVARFRASKKWQKHAKKG